jgi:cysteine desulfurase
MTIYADYAATTPCCPQSVAAMAPLWAGQGFGNAASLHPMGYAAQQRVTQAAHTAAIATHTQPHQWQWTSGATESNHQILAAMPHLFPEGGHVVISALEHDAVWLPALALGQRPGWQVTVLAVAPHTGIINPQALHAVLQPNTRLVSIMHGNNEVGTLQPVAALAAVVKRHNPAVLFHSDAAQTMGKYAENWGELGTCVDYVTASAHKCYGPKGVGALIQLNDKAPTLPALQPGPNGTDRAGTLPVPLIVGFATALQATLSAYTPAMHLQLNTWVAHIRDALLEGMPHTVWNGPWDSTDRLPGHAHVSIEGLQGEALVNQLGLRGIAVSSGSACHSAQLQPSRVVLALGRTPEQGLGTLRISLGLHTTQADVDAIISTVCHRANHLLNRRNHKQL